MDRAPTQPTPASKFKALSKEQQWFVDKNYPKPAQRWRCSFSEMPSAHTLFQQAYDQLRGRNQREKNVSNVPFDEKPFMVDDPKRAKFPFYVSPQRASDMGKVLYDFLTTLIDEYSSTSENNWLRKAAEKGAIESGAPYPKGAYAVEPTPGKSFPRGQFAENEKGNPVPSVIRPKFTGTEVDFNNGKHELVAGERVQLKKKDDDGKEFFMVIDMPVVTRDMRAPRTSDAWTKLEEVWKPLVVASGREFNDFEKKVRIVLGWLGFTNTMELAKEEKTKARSDIIDVFWRPVERSDRERRTAIERDWARFIEEERAKKALRAARRGMGPAKRKSRAKTHDQRFSELHQVVNKKASRAKHDSKTRSGTEPWQADTSKKKPKTAKKLLKKMTTKTTSELLDDIVGPLSDYGKPLFDEEFIMKNKAWRLDGSEKRFSSALLARWIACQNNIMAKQLRKDVKFWTDGNDPELFKDVATGNDYEVSAINFKWKPILPLFYLIQRHISEFHAFKEKKQEPTVREGTAERQGPNPRDAILSVILDFMEETKQPVHLLALTDDEQTALLAGGPLSQEDMDRIKRIWLHWIKEDVFRARWPDSGTELIEGYVSAQIDSMVPQIGWQLNILTHYRPWYGHSARPSLGNDDSFQRRIGDVLESQLVDEFLYFQLFWADERRSGTLERDRFVFLTIGDHEVNFGKNPVEVSFPKLTTWEEELATHVDKTLCSSAEMEVKVGTHRALDLLKEGELSRPVDEGSLLGLRKQIKSVLGLGIATSGADFGVTQLCELALKTSNPFLRGPKNPVQLNLDTVFNKEGKEDKPLEQGPFSSKYPMLNSFLMFRTRRHPWDVMLRVYSIIPFAETVDSAFGIAGETVYNLARSGLQPITGPDVKDETYNMILNTDVGVAAAARQHEQSARRVLMRMKRRSAVIRPGLDYAGGGDDAAAAAAAPMLYSDIGLTERETANLWMSFLWPNAPGGQAERVKVSSPKKKYDRRFMALLEVVNYFHVSPFKGIAKERVTQAWLLEQQSPLIGFAPRLKWPGQSSYINRIGSIVPSAPVFLDTVNKKAAARQFWAQYDVLATRRAIFMTNLLAAKLSALISPGKKQIKLDVNSKDIPMAFDRLWKAVMLIPAYALGTEEALHAKIRENDGRLVDNNNKVVERDPLPVGGDDPMQGDGGAAAAASEQKITPWVPLNTVDDSLGRIILHLVGEDKLTDAPIRTAVKDVLAKMIEWTRVTGLNIDADVNLLPPITDAQDSAFIVNAPAGYGRPADQKTASSVLRINPTGFYDSDKLSEIADGGEKAIPGDGGFDQMENIGKMVPALRFRLADGIMRQMLPDPVAAIGLEMCVDSTEKRGMESAEGERPVPKRFRLFGDTQADGDDDDDVDVAMGDDEATNLALLASLAEQSGSGGAKVGEGAAQPTAQELRAREIEAIELARKESEEVQTRLAIEESLAQQQPMADHAPNQPRWGAVPEGVSLGKAVEEDLPMSDAFSQDTSGASSEGMMSSANYLRPNVTESQRTFTVVWYPALSAPPELIDDTEHTFVVRFYIPDSGKYTEVEWPHDNLGKSIDVEVTGAEGLGLGIVVLAKHGVKSHSGEPTEKPHDRYRIRASAIIGENVTENGQTFQLQDPSEKNANVAFLHLADVPRMYPREYKAILEAQRVVRVPLDKFRDEMRAAPPPLRPATRGQRLRRYTMNAFKTEAPAWVFAFEGILEQPASTAYADHLLECGEAMTGWEKGSLKRTLASIDPDSELTDRQRIAILRTFSAISLVGNTNDYVSDVHRRNEAAERFLMPGSFVIYQGDCEDVAKEAQFLILSLQRMDDRKHPLCRLMRQYDVAMVTAVATSPSLQRFNAGDDGGDPKKYITHMYTVATPRSMRLFFPNRPRIDSLLQKSLRQTYMINIEGTNATDTGICEMPTYVKDKAKRLACANAKWEEITMRGDALPKRLDSLAFELPGVPTLKKATTVSGFSAFYRYVTNAWVMDRDLNFFEAHILSRDPVSNELKFGAETQDFIKGASNVVAQRIIEIPRTDRVLRPAILRLLSYQHPITNYQAVPSRKALQPSPVLLQHSTWKAITAMVRPMATPISYPFWRPFIELRFTHIHVFTAKHLADLKDLLQKQNWSLVGAHIHKVSPGNILYQLALVPPRNAFPKSIAKAKKAMP